MGRMKTSELTGAALDWAVAKCEGITEGKDKAWYYDRRDAYTYSTDWAHAGPIIEREEICLWSEGYDWQAKIQIGFGEWLETWGPTPMTAAMRCYVASKLGDEVDVLKELT